MTKRAFAAYECTFCRDCAKQMEFVCPNCGGELVQRPRREKSVIVLKMQPFLSAACIHAAFQ